MAIGNHSSILYFPHILPNYPNIYLQLTFMYRCTVHAGFFEFGPESHRANKLCVCVVVGEGGGGHLPTKSQIYRHILTDVGV